MSSDLFKQVFKPQMDAINTDIIDKSFGKIIMQDMGLKPKSEKLIVLSEHGITQEEFDFIIKKKKEVIDFLYKEFPEELL
jgi:hypothetical protein